MNKVVGTVLATIFCIQFLMFCYFSWVQKQQNALLSDLFSKLEKQEPARTEAIPSISPNLTKQQMSALMDSTRRSSEQLQNLIRDELTQFQNQLITTLTNEGSSDSLAVTEPSDEIDNATTQQANDTIDELYSNALTSGHWSSQDRERLRESLHMATEERRNEVLDKLIIAINNGEIITDGDSIF